jgi:hypothetical protein
MMWAARRYLKVAELPLCRVIIRFHFSGAASGRGLYWLVAQPGAEVDICTSDPGTDIDLYVETTAVSMAAAMLGRSSIARETEAGNFFLSGDPRLVRTIDRWFPREDGHDIDGVLQLRGEATAPAGGGTDRRARIN